MKLIQPKAELIQETNPYKLVELVGRTCYKSEDKITEDSYKKFVRGLIDRKHYAMLEHGRLVFRVKRLDPYYLVGIPAVHVARDIAQDLEALIVSVSLSHLYNEKWTVLCPWFEQMRIIAEAAYLDGSSTDSIINERDTISLIPGEQLHEYLREHILPPQEVFKYKTIKFTCDRGVSHELVRHRCAVAQSSTRYCNYAKDKFGKEITFVRPNEYDTWPEVDRNRFGDLLLDAEGAYMFMIERGYSPQQARAVLPNALQTEVILTMNYPQWEHFFNLRMKGTTGQPHPDMKEVATKAYQVFQSSL